MPVSQSDRDFAAGELAVKMTEGLSAGGFLGADDLTMATEVLPNLWVGGCVDGTPLPHDFGFVLSLYPWEKYALGPSTDRLQVRLFDGNELPDPELLLALARVVNNQRIERKMLVHCQAGLNRSNLITALALILDGWTAGRAIAHLRSVRSPHVLFNAVFANWLRTVG